MWRDERSVMRSAHTTQRLSYVWCQHLTCDCLWLAAIKYNDKERDKGDDYEKKEKMRKKNGFEAEMLHWINFTD